MCGPVLNKGEHNLLVVKDWNLAYCEFPNPKNRSDWNQIQRNSYLAYLVIERIHLLCYWMLGPFCSCAISFPSSFHPSSIYPSISLINFIFYVHVNVIFHVCFSFSFDVMSFHFMSFSFWFLYCFDNFVFTEFSCHFISVHFHVHVHCVHFISCHVISPTKQCLMNGQWRSSLLLRPCFLPLLWRSWHKFPWQYLSRLLSMAWRRIIPWETVSLKTIWISVQIYVLDQKLTWRLPESLMCISSYW